MKTVGFFEESEGIKSSTRLIFIIGSLWAIIMGTFLLCFSKTPQPPMEVAGFVAAVVGTFGAIKTAVGSLSENKTNIIEQDSVESK
jgi:hypothetical protein